MPFKPWRLGSTDDPSVKIEVRLPQSLKEWLQNRPKGISETIRHLVERAKKRSERP